MRAWRLWWRINFVKLIDLLIKSSREFPTKTACINGNIHISYEQMSRCVRLLAEQLKNIGCRGGVKVALVLNNSIEYLIGFFAVSAVGGIIYPLSGSMTTREISRYMARADISLVITNRSLGSRLIDQLRDCYPAAVLYIQYCGEYTLQIDSRQYTDCRADEVNRDVALMVPTSGSTGSYKIAMLTDENLICNMLTYRATMNFRNPNIVYCALPMYHIYPICAQILTHISLGDTFIVKDTPFFIKEFIQAVQEFKVTISAFVPYMAMHLADFPDAKRFKLESLKYITLSGAKTPKATYHRLKKRYPTVSFVNMYGMTEAGSRITLAAPHNGPYPDDSVGKPMPGVIVKIINRNGEMVPRNGTGQILVKSHGVMKGYYHQSELTRKTLAGGWLHTGDLGRLDEYGNLFLVGRIKDIILSGGHNINPAEIEECILAHPSVAQVAVVAKKDRLLQEVPAAFVVKNDPLEKLKPADIVKLCQIGLSSYKVPRVVNFLNELPTLNNSKIDRNRLKKSC